MQLSEYSIDEHLHRFAVWTAARAASKGRLKNSEVEYLIDKSNLREEVLMLKQLSSLDEAYYRNWIQKTGSEICRLVQLMNWGEYKLKTFSFGIAAKIISIYIKTVEVLPSGGQSLLAQIAYPPIDSILLKNIHVANDVKFATNWSKFEWAHYEEAILRLNEYYPNVPKWKIEVEWKVSNEEIDQLTAALLDKK